MFRVLFLGQVEAYSETRELTGGARPQERAVLAVLADNVGYSVNASDLLDGIWGPADSDRSRGTLQCHISRLRRRLDGIGEIIRKAGGYQLRCAQVEVDAHVFKHLVDTASGLEIPERVQALERALRLWRGDAFQGIDVPYAARRRDQLARLRLRAVLQWSDVMLTVGESARAVEVLESMWPTNPLCEPLVARLMVGLGVNGYTAEALAWFERLRKRLSVELGQSPGAEVSGIHLRILRGECQAAELTAALGLRF